MTIQEIKNRSKRIVLFGATNNSIVNYLLYNGLNISYFIDNDEKKHINGVKGYSNIEVKPVAFLKKDILDDIIIIISTYNYIDEMEAQLKSMGVGNYLVAIRDIDDLKNVHFHAFKHNVDIDKLKIDFLHLELSGYCNCKCQYCFFHGIPNKKNNYKGFMSMETAKLIVDQMKRIKTISGLDIVGNGEVFLNKNWYEITNYVIKELNISYLMMYTNGMLLTENEVERIKSLDVEEIRIEVSIDGTTPLENNQYRIGSDYETIKKNVYKAREIFGDDDRLKMIITNNYPIKLSEKESCEKMTVITKEVPRFIVDDFPGLVHTSQSTAGQSCDNNIPGLVPVEVSRDDGTEICLNVFHRLEIDSYGKMIKCHCWNGAFDEIGDVKKDDLIKIWYENKELNEARDNLLNRRQGDDFCEGCPGRGYGNYYLLAEVD